MTSKSSFSVFVALLAFGSLIGACGDGEIADPRLGSDDEPMSGQPGVDAPAPDQFGDEQPAPGVTGVPYGHVVPADVGVSIGVGVVAPVPTVQYTGSCSPASGATIENVVINNCAALNIRNPNITLRNVILNGSANPFAIRLDGRDGGNADNFTVEYSHINQTNGDGAVFGAFGAAGGGGTHTNWTIRNNEIEGGYDWHYIEGDLDGFLCENNYYHTLSVAPSSGRHADGFQIAEGPNQVSTGLLTIRGNYFDPNNAVGKTALIFSTGNSSTNNTTILFESNFVPIWGAYTVWCADSDACTARYNVYRQDFKTKLGNRTQGTGTESDGYPNAAYKVEPANAPNTVYACNRYEDGDFIEDQWVDQAVNLTSNCPSY